MKEFTIGLDVILGLISFVVGLIVTLAVGNPYGLVGVVLSLVLLFNVFAIGD